MLDVAVAQCLRKACTDACLPGTRWHVHDLGMCPAHHVERLVRFPGIALAVQPAESLMLLHTDTSLEQLAATHAGGQGGSRSCLSLTGCLLLQSLLAMPQAACASFTGELAGLTQVQLAMIAHDACGAHVLQAFFKVACPVPLCLWQCCMGAQNMDMLCLLHRICGYFLTCRPGHKVCLLARPTSVFVMATLPRKETCVTCQRLIL